MSAQKEGRRDGRGRDAETRREEGRDSQNHQRKITQYRRRCSSQRSHQRCPANREQRQLTTHLNCCCCCCCCCCGCCCSGPRLFSSKSSPFSSCCHRCPGALFSQGIRKSTDAKTDARVPVAKANEARKHDATEHRRHGRKEDGRRKEGRKEGGK